MALMGPAARAETPEGWLDQVGFDRMNRYVQSEAGFDALDFLKKLLTGGDFGGENAMKVLMDGLWTEARRAFTSMLKPLLSPVAMCAGLKLAVGRKHTAAQVASLACVLCCALVLVEQLNTSAREAGAFLDAMKRASDVLTPVTAAACALTGAVETAALMQPLAAECATIAEYAFGNVGLSMCAAAGAVAVAGSLSERLPLTRLYELIRSVVKWLLGAAMLLFGALMSIQGSMGAARDSAALRAARTAMDALVPALGGGLSNVTGALSVSAGTLRRAVGITGMVCVAHLCFAPLLRLAASMIAVKLAAAALEPLSEGPAATLAGRFGELLELMLAICLTCAVMTALLAGGCAVLLGGAMG